MKLTKVQKIICLIIVLLLFSVAVTITWAVMTSRSQVTGSSFTTARPDLLLFKDVSGSPIPSNLANTLTGFTFDKITSNWLVSQTLKLYNGGDVTLDLEFKNQLVPTLEYNSVLPHWIYMQVTDWQDHNQDGVWQSNEMGTVLSSWKTLAEWESHPISLGILNPGHVKPLALHFKVDDLNNNFLDQVITYDFIFDATTMTGGVH